MKKNLNNLIAILGILSFFIFIFRFGYKYYHLEYYGNSTYGRIDSLYEDWRYDKKVIYSFKVDQRKYHGDAWYDDKIKPKVGEVYRVTYSSKDPDINKLQLREK